MENKKVKAKEERETDRKERKEQNTRKGKAALSDVMPAAEHDSSSSQRYFM